MIGRIAENIEKEQAVGKILTEAVVLSIIRSSGQVHDGKHPLVASH